MKKGGYKIVSLKSPTIYDDIESNLYKPILLTDIVLDDIEKNDLFVNIETENAKFVINAYNKTITIDSDNNVNIVDGGNHLYQYSFDIEQDTYRVRFKLLSSYKKSINNIDDLISFCNENNINETCAFGHFDESHLIVGIEQISKNDNFNYCNVYYYNDGDGYETDESFEFDFDSLSYTIRKIF